MVADEESVISLKPEDIWSDIEDVLANSNSKALNALFNDVNPIQFIFISTCESTKKTWKIFQITYEGTSAVKLSKMQMLTTRFESLKMHEDKSIAEFNSKLCDIANEAFALGEIFPEERPVKKNLRSLPQRFAYKVTVIEEAKNVFKINLEELIGSLRTFKLKEADVIATTMPKLKHLEMGNSTLSSGAVMNILSNCSHLEFLDLEWSRVEGVDQECLRQKFPKVKIEGPLFLDHLYQEFSRITQLLLASVLNQYTRLTFTSSVVQLSVIHW